MHEDHEFFLFAAKVSVRPGTGVVFPQSCTRRSFPIYASENVCSKQWKKVILMQSDSKPRSLSAVDDYPCVCFELSGGCLNFRRSGHHGQRGSICCGWARENYE